MSHSPLTVLVTGATGRQGGAVARALLAKGHKVRALTRKPESPAAEALRVAGAGTVPGDFDDRASLARAMAGVDAVFAMTTPFENGPSAETRDGIALVDAAKAARVRHFVYSSVCGADKATGVPHFESKWRVEQHLGASDVPFTVLGPVYFMENAFGPWSLPGLQAGALARSLPPGRRLQQVAVASLGSFAALVLERRDRMRGRRIDVASDELTGTEEAEILSRVTGRKIAFSQTPIENIRGMSKDMALMFEWFDRVGYGAELARLRQEYPEVTWLRFSDWAAGQGFPGPGSGAGG
jgi:uncharacterized protein YbjT (DUF2867 family)